MATSACFQVIASTSKAIWFRALSSSNLNFAPVALTKNPPQLGFIIATSLVES
jgi:hypothetical protein